MQLVGSTFKFSTGYDTLFSDSRIQNENIKVDVIQ